MKERAPLWLLVVFLCVVFFTGGSSWSSEPQLMLLRPMALIIAGCAILTLRWEHVVHYWVIWGIFLAIVLLTLVHMVPLPFKWWSSLPGREIIVTIDQVAGLGQISRPISMAPDATLNALYSLSVPFAVLLLSVQLKLPDHRRILLLLFLLAALSGLFGLLQASGVDIAFYPDQTPTSGLLANRNHQGALLALLIPLAASVGAFGFGDHASLIERVALAPAVTVITIPLLLVTGSRSALMVAAVGLVFALFIWLPCRRYERRSWWLRLAPPVSLTACVGGLIWITGFAARDLAIDRLGGAEDDLRWALWKSIIEMLPDYMPWGTGIGSYVQAYQVLEPDGLLRPTISNHAHNDFLEVALTAGIPGIILMGFAAAALLFSLWRAFFSMNGDSPASIFSRLGTAAIVLLAIASFTDYPTRTPVLVSVLALAAVWAFTGRQAVDSCKTYQGSK